MKKIWKASIIFLINIIIISYPFRITNGCGGDWTYPEDDFHYLFNQELIPKTGYESFLLYFPSRFYPYEGETEFSDQVRNVKEWQSYFEGAIPEDKVKEIVYDYPVSTLQEILNQIEAGKTDKRDEVFIYFTGRKDSHALKYLIFIREIQPIVSGLDHWEGCAHDISYANDIYGRGEGLHNEVKSKFLQLRVAYQLTRLAHYTGDYKKCIYYYDNLVEKHKSESFIRYWALGHKAGSLKALDQIPEAIYFYSLVFANSYDKREPAFRSAWFYGEDFERGMEYCKNDRERVIMHFLNALEYSLPNLEPLKNIYEIDPSSKELEVLVMREVKKAESYYTGSFIFEDASNTENSKLKDFMLLASESGNVRTPALWYLLSGYIFFLNKYFTKATQLIEKSESFAHPDKNLADETRIIKALINIDKRDSVSPQFEKKILDEFTWLEKKEKTKSSQYQTSDFEKAKKYLLERLMLKYANQGDDTKALLCKNIFKPIDLYNDMDEKVVDNFINHLKDNKKSKMEIFLSSHLQYSLPQLYEMKGTFALRRAEFKEALDYLKKGKPYDFYNGDGMSYNNPFKSEINICVNCEDPENTGRMTKNEFAEKMLEYERLAKSKKKDAANYYYLLGLGMYNTTLYGSSYNLTNYSKSSYSTGGHYETDIALEYFKKSLQLSKDKELSAKACFMAAKCEQRITSDNIEEIFVDEYYEYFKKLNDNYSDTEFYKEVIQECKYFNIFVKNNRD